MSRQILLCSIAIALLASAACSKGTTESAPAELPSVRAEAESGNATAQHNLGRMYATGDGVPKDSTEAAKWFRKSAEQGDAGAQFYIGAMYAKGDGVPKDLVQAHAWWNIAGSQGFEDAKKGLVSLEKEMTPDQKAEAMKLPREMFARLEKK